MKISLLMLILALSLEANHTVSQYNSDGSSSFSIVDNGMASTFNSDGSNSFTVFR